MSNFLNPGEYYAQGVFFAINNFVQIFEDKGELNTARLIIKKQNKSLQGGYVGQTPERFTEENLIKPVLQALGYEEIIARPADLVPDERQKPDFLIENVDEVCVVIVEAKRFGLLSETEGDSNMAEEQMAKYLSKNALVKYKRDLDVRYLVGIATDGVYWSLLIKNLDTGEQERVRNVSLSDVFKQVVLAYQFPKEVEDRWRVTLRNQIYDFFVPHFNIKAVISAVNGSGAPGSNKQ